MLYHKITYFLFVCLLSTRSIHFDGPSYRINHIEMEDRGYGYQLTLRINRKQIYIPVSLFGEVSWLMQKGCQICNNQGYQCLTDTSSPLVCPTLTCNLAGTEEKYALPIANGSLATVKCQFSHFAVPVSLMFVVTSRLHGANAGRGMFSLIWKHSIFENGLIIKEGYILKVYDSKNWLEANKDKYIEKDVIKLAMKKTHTGKSITIITTNFDLNVLPIFLNSTFPIYLTILSSYLSLPSSLFEEFAAKIIYSYLPDKNCHMTSLLIKCTYPIILANLNTVQLQIAVDDTVITFPLRVLWTSCKPRYCKLRVKKSSDYVLQIGHFLLEVMALSYSYPSASMELYRQTNQWSKYYANTTIIDTKKEGFIMVMLIFSYRALAALLKIILSLTLLVGLVSCIIYRPKIMHLLYRIRHNLLGYGSRIELKDTYNYHELQNDKNQENAQPKSEILTIQ